MLDSISWQQFLYTATIITACYYAVVILLFYRNEIINLFRQKSGVHNHTEDDTNHYPNLVGRPKYSGTEPATPREELKSADEFNFLPPSEIEEPVNLQYHEAGILIGTRSDLIEEIKTLVEVVATTNKEESTPLFQSLLSRYPQLVATHHQETITLFIYHTCRQQCEFHFELNEIKSWWPQPDTEHDTNQ